VSDMGKYLQIKEIGKVITGKTPSTEDASNFDGKYPFITPSDIKSFDEKYLLETERTLSEKGIKKLKNNILPKEAICFVCIGSTIGKMCLTNTIAYSNQQINSLIVNNNFDAHYMFYFLRYIKSYFQQLGAGTGSGKGIVNKTTFENSKVKVETNKNIQVKIADILSTYDNLIENNNKRIRLLEQMAENLYKEWFVRFRFPGYENVEFENGIPKSWEIKRLFEFGKIETGKTPPKERDQNYGGDIMFVKTPDMHDNIYVISTDEFLSIEGHLTQPKKLLPENSIMVSCIGTGGVVAINDRPAHTNQQINSIILSKSEYLEWLYFVCKNLKEIIEMFGATGSTMTNLSKGKFEKLKIVTPPEKLILEYRELTKNLFIEVRVLLHKNDLLAKQRDMLLSRLMSGKLEV